MRTLYISVCLCIQYRHIYIYVHKYVCVHNICIFLFLYNLATSVKSRVRVGSSLLNVSKLGHIKE